MNAFRYIVVDVFTDRPLAGNQLAVFTNASQVPESLLQPLAREMNFSETVFLFPRTDSAHARMRIFTPRIELPFAGHPILGAAFILAAQTELDEVLLETGRGVIAVAIERQNRRPVFGWMSQPIPTVMPFAHTAELLPILDVPRSVLPVELYDNGVEHLFVVLESEEAVRQLRPDLRALARLLHDIGANCAAGVGIHWKTRYFGPGVGVDEDPATGSAAGPLAFHLARHGRIAFGQQIEISQGAELGRPSTLYARVTGTADRTERVEVGGSAVQVAQGEFRLP